MLSFVVICVHAILLERAVLKPSLLMLPLWRWRVQGIVHRDIKSENVFRTASGAWKLGDFGSSLRIGDERLLNKQVC